MHPYFAEQLVSQNLRNMHETATRFAARRSCAERPRPAPPPHHHVHRPPPAAPAPREPEQAAAHLIRTQGSR